MSYITKNYFAHGGNELVIGGKLTFLPGASVEGGEGLFESAGGEVQIMPYMADSEATTVAALKESFNTLLAGLRAAGFMASEAAQESGDKEVEEGSDTPPEQSGDGA